MTGRRLVIGATFAAALLFGLCARMGGNVRLEKGIYLDPDSFTFAREARLSYEGRSMGDRDPQRWYPEGRDRTRMQLLWSKTLATVAHIIRPVLGNASFQDVARFSSVITFLLCLVPFYFIISRIFRTGVALLAVLLLSAWPVCFPRSCIGYADRDAFCLLLATISYALYVQSWESSVQRGKVLNFASGAAISLLGFAWEGYGLFSVVLATHWLARLVLGKNKMATSTPPATYWCIGALLPVLLCPVFHCFKPYVLLAVVPPATVMAVTASLWLGSLVSTKVSWFWPWIAATIIIGLLVPFVWLRSAALSYVFRDFASWMATPLGESRLMQIVSELSTPSLRGWATQFGSGCLGLLIGLPWLATRVVSGRLSRALVLTGSCIYSALLMGCNLSTEMTTPNDSWTRLIRMVALGVLAVSWVLSILITDHTLAIQARQSEGYLFIYIWAVVLFQVTAATVRFMIFLALPVAGLLAWLVFELESRAEQALPKSYTNCVRAVMSLALVGVLLLFLQIDRRIELKNPRMDESFVDSMNWSRMHLPADAVVLAPWDRGTFVTELADRATVIDADHYLPDRIVEASQNFWCSVDDAQALRFVSRYRITHIVVSKFDLSIIASESYMSVTSQSPIYIVPTFFTMDGPTWPDFEQSGEFHIRPLQTILPGTRIINDAFGDGIISVTRHRINSPLEVTGGWAETPAPHNRIQHRAFNKIILGNHLFNSPKYPNLPGTLFLFPEQRLTADGNGSALYIPKGGERYLILRLALDRDLPNWLRCVYETSHKIPSDDRVFIYVVRQPVTRSNKPSGAV